MVRHKPYLKPILMATSVAVEPLSVKNTLDAQPLPGPSSSLSATYKHAYTAVGARKENTLRAGTVLLYIYSLVRT